MMKSHRCNMVKSHLVRSWFISFGLVDLFSSVEILIPVVLGAGLLEKPPAPPEDPKLRQFLDCCEHVAFSRGKIYRFKKNKILSPKCFKLHTHIYLLQYFFDPFRFLT